MHVATDTTMLYVAKNMNKAWLLETERQTCCRIKCLPLKSISSYLSVQLPFRLPYPHSQMLPPSSNSLSDSRVHLGSSVSKKRWHQSPASPAFLFISLLFDNTVSVIFRAILHQWIERFWFVSLSAFQLFQLQIFFSYKHQPYQIEWILPMYLTCELGNGPEHAQIWSETHLRISLAR